MDLTLIAWVPVAFIVLLILVKTIMVPQNNQSPQKEYAAFHSSTFYRQTGYTYNEVMADEELYGAYQIARTLQSYENKGARLLYDLYFSHNNRYVKTDALMIHPAGLFVFENKNLIGKICGSDSERTWTQTIKGDTEEFVNPFMENAIHAKALNNALGMNVPMHSVVVFADQAALKIKYPKNHPPAVKWNQLRTRLKELTTKEPMHLTSQQINQIYSQLLPYTNPPGTSNAPGMNTREQTVATCPECHTIVKSAINTDNTILCPICGAEFSWRNNE